MERDAKFKESPEAERDEIFKLLLLINLQVFPRKSVIDSLSQDA